MSAARATTEDSVNAEALSRPVLLHGTRGACGMAGCAMSGSVPDFFTLPEVGQILRIGRNSAYKLAAEFKATKGRSGLPFVQFGKLRRVSRLVVENLKGGPITWPIPDDGRAAPARKSKPRTAQSNEVNATAPGPDSSTAGTTPALKRSKKAVASSPGTVVSSDEQPEVAVAQVQAHRKAKTNATRGRNALLKSTPPEPVEPSADQQLGLGI